MLARLLKTVSKNINGKEKLTTTRVNNFMVSGACMVGFLLLIDKKMQKVNSEKEAGELLLRQVCLYS